VGTRPPHGRDEGVIFLCKLEELSGDPSTRNVILGEGEDELDIVIVQTKGARHAYINCCPHQLIPLETFPNHFLTEDKNYFVCSGHGARFQLDTGKCVYGPCLGKGLDPLATIEQDGALYLNEPLSPGEIARARLSSRRW
jgi:nitrite reductase/ring-hydroxylating ferredoxin subunit